MALSCSLWKEDHNETYFNQTLENAAVHNELCEQALTLHFFENACSCFFSLKNVLTSNGKHKVRQRNVVGIKVCFYQKDETTPKVLYIVSRAFYVRKSTSSDNVEGDLFFNLVDENGLAWSCSLVDLGVIADSDGKWSDNYLLIHDDSALVVKNYQELISDKTVDNMCHYRPLVKCRNPRRSGEVTLGAYPI